MAEKLALVGSESLMGREVRDLLAGNSLGQDIRLIAAEDEEPGKLTEAGGVPSLVIQLNAENLEDAGAIVLAGSAKSSSDVLALKPVAPIIDLTHAAEDHPAHVCARPWSSRTITVFRPTRCK